MAAAIVGFYPEFFKLIAKISFSEKIDLVSHLDGFRRILFVQS
jgi:hypothetical protein